APQETLFASVVRGLRQSAVVVGLSLLFGVAAFALGLIPVIGGVVGSLAGAVIAAFFIVVEMISGPFDRWGMRRLSEKFGAVNRNRALALGFGLPAFLLLSVPLLAVLLFPVHTAGGRLLAGEPRGEDGPVVVPRGGCRRGRLGPPANGTRSGRARAPRRGRSPQRKQRIPQECVAHQAEAVGPDDVDQTSKDGQRRHGVDETIRRETDRTDPAQRSPTPPAPTGSGAATGRQPCR